MFELDASLHLPNVRKLVKNHLLTFTISP